MSTPLLSMSGISKSFFGVSVLRDIDFVLEAGTVHALVGENGAGKSTLMKILLGIYAKDSGEIRLDGKSVEFKKPLDALENAISMIHQEISLVPTLDVAENIWLGREERFSRCGCLSLKKRYEATKALLEELEIEIDPKTKVQDLSVAVMQLVELCRALSYDSRIIIMDEPTSALAAHEIELLLRIIRKLRAKGVAIIFISHKLDEILEICDTVTVLRDGNLICRKAVSEVTEGSLIEMIAGRKLENIYPKRRVDKGKVVLEVRGLERAGVFRDVGFQVREGEILGFSGLMGAGRTEIMRGLYGLDRIDGGEIRMDGKRIRIASPKDAVEAGIGMVTEDRLTSGGIATMSVRGNSTLPSLSDICNLLGVFSQKRENEMYESVSTKLSIKCNSPSDLIKQLSGGNQQKVIISRWLLKKPKLIIMDEPTRGIDVGAKQEGYNIISGLVEQGIAIILVSSELPEVMALSDRICVVRNGRIVYETPPDATTQEDLMAYAFGVKS